MKVGDTSEVKPEHTAVRVALWRALHLELDAPPFVFTDNLGPKIVNEINWRQRPDMEAGFSKSMRASIVGRSRFIEDLVEEKYKEGIRQYVILGAGLDTFAQRRPELMVELKVFEVDQPGPQKWKTQRLQECELPLSENLHFVPVDFEAGQSWWQELVKYGFDLNQPAIVVSTGVSMYLSHETNIKTLEQISDLPVGSTFAMTFMLSLELLPPDEKKIMEFVMARAAEAKTPFVSLFRPEDIVELAKQAGFSQAEYVSADQIFRQYFLHRNDGLNAGQAEAFLVATV